MFFADVHVARGGRVRSKKIYGRIRICVCVRYEQIGVGGCETGVRGGFGGLTYDCSVPGERTEDGLWW
jgi:hypothetical protein